MASSLYPTDVLMDSTVTTKGTTHLQGSVCGDMDVGESSASSTLDIASTSAHQGSLSDYELSSLIGRGKYSQVFVGVDLRTQQRVAVKRVEIFDMMDTVSRQACLKEVKILQNVEHSNIVKCYKSFIQDNELVIVLEWAEAGDLAHLLKARAEAGQYFSVEQVWIQFYQICTAIEHMHERRMMHRDLKPSNIFVTASGDLKIGDLGLSRYFSSRTLQAQTTVGTPYYMSPECIKGQPYDFSSDVWSLGCLLYELITLRNPFYKEHQSLYVLGKNITACAYEPLPESVPEPLRQLVTAMLQPTPSVRPSAAHIVQYIENAIEAMRSQAAAAAAAQQQQNHQQLPSPVARSPPPVPVAAPSSPSPNTTSTGSGPDLMGLAVTGFGVQPSLRPASVSASLRR